MFFVKFFTKNLKTAYFAIKERKKARCYRLIISPVKNHAYNEKTLLFLESRVLKPCKIKNFYNSLIRILRNETALPWSCKPIFPLLYLPKPPQPLNLLLATIASHSGPSDLYFTESVPF